jgi:hypothetical protein
MVADVVLKKENDPTPMGRLDEFATSGAPFVAMGSATKRHFAAILAIGGSRREKCRRLL